MRKLAVAECLRVLSAIVLLPRLVDIPLEIRQWQGVASYLLSSEITKVSTKLLLCQVREQQLDGFSGSS